MAYRNLRACVDDLERHGQLIRIEAPVDARLEAAAIHRRVFAAGGPALYFANVLGCRFPLVSNLFGTMDRVRLMFRDALAAAESLVALRADPQQALAHPLRHWRAPFDALLLRPKLVRSGPILQQRTTLSQLPQVQCWPADGGPFVTLPAVYSEDPAAPGLARSNLGMYRVQLAGNQYAADRQVGLHYQIHRSIGVHHEAARRAGKPFRVNIHVGGPPALAVAAVMPLPEGMSELGFAGLLSRRRLRLVRRPGALPVCAEADFCITGTVEPDLLLPEGPFGDHLGYYSLAHPFPVVRVEEVFCRRDAIWPFTVVGRPPQEDSNFGRLIHELTGPMIPAVLPGIRAVHAVDAAGVHPLLLAIGSERYTPYADATHPQELLTQASALLGQGQLSLAKFLLIAAHGDDPPLKIHDVGAFLEHMLARADWQRDLHFHTQTTIDTLDYSGHSINAGSKLVIAAAGPARFALVRELPTNLVLPEGFRNPRVALPGVLAVEGPACPKPTFDYDAAQRVRRESRAQLAGVMKRFCIAVELGLPVNSFRWIVVVDDSQFVAQSLDNFLWAVFTRANPAEDVYGVGEFYDDKHWGCRGALVLDARIKPYHAPALEEDPAIARRVDALAARGGPLHGVF